MATHPTTTQNPVLSDSKPERADPGCIPDAGGTEQSPPTADGLPVTARDHLLSAPLYHVEVTLQESLQKLCVAKTPRKVYTITVHGLKRGNSLKLFETTTWITFSCLTPKAHCPKPQTQDGPPGVMQSQVSQRSTWDKGCKSKTPKTPEPHHAVPASFNTKQTAQPVHWIPKSKGVIEVMRYC